jgi:hypothetical protein
MAAKIQSYFPAPNLPGNVNNFYFAGSNPNNTTTYHARVDYNLTATNRLTGSFVYGRNGGTSSAPTCPTGAYDGGSCTSRIENESQEQKALVYSIAPGGALELASAGERFVIAPARTSFTHGAALLSDAPS